MSTKSETQFQEPYSNKDQIIKRNFDFIREKLSRYRKQMTKEDQENASYLIHTIESYGFNFFSSHFVYDYLEELFNLTNRVTGHNDQIRFNL